MRRRTGAMAGGAALGAIALALTAAPAQANTEVEWPEEFTSAFTAMAVPDEVIDSDGRVSPGEPGATGDFMLWINSDTETICYEITLDGVTGQYESPAITATHIHEAAAGESGPPRVAFPDPMPIGDGPRDSAGCMQGPFTVGVEDDEGNDRAEGFSLRQIEDDPAAFNADTHTSGFADGTVRGQLMRVPLDGMETGGGGLANHTAAGPAAGAGFVALAMVGFGYAVLRDSRQRT